MWCKNCLRFRIKNLIRYFEDKKIEKRSKYETRVRRMKMQLKVPSVGADDDAATIFRTAKRNIQPANQISFNKNNLK